MISIQQYTNWSLRPISAFRFLEGKYVDTFLNEGKIQLSSFKKFRQHQDEVRGDGSEGSGFYLANHKPEVGEGHAFGAMLNGGSDAYVLSTSQVDSLATFSGCNYDAGFIIKDVIGFAIEISRAIPFFKGGMIGQCIYKDPPVIPVDLGQFNINDLSPEEVEQKQNQFFDKIKNDPELFFLKHMRHRSQEEFRIIWFVDRASEYIDITCPNAVRLCQKL
jgi:hypothetical protein